VPACQYTQPPPNIKVVRGRRIRCRLGDKKGGRVKEKEIIEAKRKKISERGEAKKGTRMGKRIVEN